MDPLSNTVIDDGGASANGVTVGAGIDASNRNVLKDVHVTGFTISGIVAGGYTTLDNVFSGGNNEYGLNVSSGTDLEVLNSSFNGNDEGIKFSQGTDLDGLTIDNCHFDNNAQHGWYDNVSSSSPTRIRNVVITNSTFNGNPGKGIYTEKMDMALLDGITVDGSGTNTGGHSAGIDINLKYNTYSDISIINSTITNCGVNDANGGGLLIKARSTGSYAGNPATLDDVTVANNFFSGNGGTGSYSATVRVGEANNALAGVDAGPTNVVLFENSFGASTAAHELRNATAGALVTAECNWWGTTDALAIAALTFGNVDFAPALDNGTDDDVATGFQPVPGSCGAPVYPVNNVTQVIGYLDIASALNDPALAANDVIVISPGTYTETGLSITLPVTIRGESPADAATTIVDNTGGFGFLPGASNITIKDLTIDGGSQGIRIDGAYDGITIDGVTLSNQSSRGVELHNSANLTNFLVTGSTFDAVSIGIRMASSAEADGVDIIQSTFLNNTLGFYQANDGSTGKINDLFVDQSVFTNNSFAGVYGEEMTNVIVQQSTFTGNGRGFYLFKAYNTAGVDAANITVQGNTFTHSSAASVLFVLAAGATTSGMLVDDNLISQDLSNRTSNWGSIDVRMSSGISHGTFTISNNQVNLSGTLVAGAAEAAHGIKLRGALGQVNIIDNDLDGGNIGSIAGVGIAPTSGVYIVTDHPDYGPLTTASVVNISGNVSGNQITGFYNGISLFDEVAGVFGNLTPGATVYVAQNNITSNSNLGIENGAASETVNANDNWWGDASGPGPIGPGTGDGVSVNVQYCTWLDAAYPAGVSIGPGGLVVNTNTGETFCSIQNAIDDPQTLDGHTLVIAAGTYPEYLTVNKQLTLQGPFAGTAGTDGARGVGEAIITPPVSNLVDGVLVSVEADAVTLDGLTLNGASQAVRGINLASQTGLTVQNNIIENFINDATTALAPTNEAAALMARSTVGVAATGTISGNLIRGVTDVNGLLPGSGIALLNDFQATVTGNETDQVEVGLYVSTQTQAGNLTITGNAFSADEQGVSLIGLTSAPTLDLSGNTVVMDQHFYGATPDPSTGILLLNVDAANKSVSSNDVSDGYFGYLLFGTAINGTDTLTINGGTMDGNTRGIALVNDLGAPFGTAPGAVVVDGVTVQNSFCPVPEESEAGVYAFTSGASALTDNLVVFVRNSTLTGLRQNLSTASAALYIENFNGGDMIKFYAHDVDITNNGNRAFTINRTEVADLRRVTMTGNQTENTPSASATGVFRNNTSNIYLTQNVFDNPLANYQIRFDADCDNAVLFNNTFLGTGSGHIQNNGPNTIDASGNWWNSNAPATVAGSFSGSPVDYSPWLEVGGDTDAVTNGFQGSFATLNVDDNSPQAGAVAHIQE
ncbi:MAG: hypothetical protein D6722_19810, partial [Bacteroidetes bacterium]